MKAGQGTARESRASRKAATLNLLEQGKIKKIKGGDKNDICVLSGYK